MASVKKGDTRTKKKQQADVLAAFEECGNISHSCKKAKVPRRTFYSWLKNDKSFKGEFDKSIVLANAVLEDEAKRRATEGVLEPVYHQGKKVGSVRKYSDTLLIVLLKAHMPDKYKDRIASNVRIGGPNGEPLTLPEVKIYNCAPPLASSESEINE